MNLIERKREEHRGRVFQRVGSVLVCMSLLLAVAFPPQEAKAAFVLDDMAVASVAAAFLASCGMTFAASGMDSSGVAEQVGKVIDSYLQEEFAGQSRMDWIGDAMSAGLSISRGQLALSSLLSNKLADLARWVQGEYGVKADSNILISNKNMGYGVCLADGEMFYFGLFDITNNEIVCAGTDLLSSGDLEFANGYTLSHEIITNKWDDLMHVITFHYGNGSHSSAFYASDSSGYVLRIISDGNIEEGCYRFCGIRSNGSLDCPGGGYYKFLDEILGNATEVITNFELRTGESINLPDTIPDDKEVTISTGAASDLTLDQALEQVLAAIAEGQLSATREITEAGTAADDPAIPGEETIPDIEGLGLPALGAVFTTRFPFSIPWDIARGIKLLAAPAKTPRFEVDFFEPIRYRFGGNLGDTTIVLDFSEYEIIGQVSRWASTIGFCLLLAGGTKRLIWTA